MGGQMLHEQMYTNAHDNYSCIIWGLYSIVV